MNYLLPSEVANLACDISAKKSGFSLRQLVILGILAGAYVGLGANLATVAASDAPKYVGSGIAQFIFGAVFSVGLMLVVIAGGELFTGNNMYMVMGVLDKKCTLSDLLRNWIVVWLANFVGSLLLVGLVAVAYYGSLSPETAAPGLLKGAVGVKALLIAKGKLELTWLGAFSRAILCNWLVCLAVWLALASHQVAGKILAIFFPIMAFVACGFEHSVANMFFIPMGMLISYSPALVDLAAPSVLTAKQASIAAAGASLRRKPQTPLPLFKHEFPRIFT